MLKNSILKLIMISAIIFIAIIGCEKENKKLYDKIKVSEVIYNEIVVCY